MDTLSQPRPRVIGAVYLLYFLSSSPALMLLRPLVVPNDAAATANNILTHEDLYQFAVSLGLVGNAFYIALTALFYVLLKPVGPRVALLFAFFSLAGCIVQLCGGFFQIAPLVVLNDPHLTQALEPAQVHAAVMLSLKMYSQVYQVSFVLFGLFDISIGWLLLRSTFIPWVIGLLMMLGGIVSLGFLWPSVAMKFFPYFVGVGGLGELALMLWLLVMGVNAEKWRRKTGLVEAPHGA